MFFERDLSGKMPLWSLRAGPNHRKRSIPTAFESWVWD